MPKFYTSISPDLRDWALRQSVFFVASAPLRGRHVNLSPKGLPDSSFAILGPNEAAYVDATGSGNETICHLRDNGRITVMFCSFETSPRILRFFCTGSVIEWNQSEFAPYLERMGEKKVVGARAIIRLDVFKVQTSCGYGVPQLALTLDPETHKPTPYLKDRETLGHWANKKVESNQLREYQQQCNSRSLDGLPGLRRITRHHPGASGSASDRRHAIAEFARNYPQDPVDVIIADFMSEANMVTAAARRVDQDKQDPSGAPTAPGYELAFLLALQPALEDLAKHKIKVAVNAGNTDTEGLYQAVIKMIQAKGLDLKVAWVSGDEVLSTVKSSLSSGKSTFKNVYTGETLSNWSFEPIYAQCYLGGLGVAAALAQGADIVLCGRVSDASPVIGAAYWFHSWSRNDLDQLANAFVAGHLIECSNYVCGGNYTGFKTLEHVGKDGWSNIGYPIAEIAADGRVVITMQSYATGGAVTVDTCSSQLLYEIQGPWYFNSDVTAILTDLHFEQVGVNRVALQGVRSAPPPPTTKVGITARGGFQAEASWFLVGLDIDSKARMLEAQIRRLLAPYSSKFTAFTFSTLGSSPDDPRGQNDATVTFRVVVQARNADDIAPANFLRHITDNIMQGYPGATFHLDLRQGFPKPVYEYYVSLLRQEDIKHRVHLPWKNQTVDVPAPPVTREYPSRQPSQAITTAPVNRELDFGATVRGPLGWIVHARSGDKGPDANCGFWVRHSDEYLWLRMLLSAPRVKELLGPEYNANAQLDVERFELPNLRGVHFLFRNLLDRGVGVTTTVDFLGKNVAEFLRAKWVDLPVKFLNRGKL
ncbi:hypothetical protein FE257_012245 [Aspergillus nanangensis]|uniref:DUF1446 domain protein n=1 Tax=Aspergillus nanangensis TaxID=2582783 RepID=A0AAD4GQU8_ASPNN|nr:hypothetical protein FE257_012245 [Aspergillus nanangensis]